MSEVRAGLINPDDVRQTATRDQADVMLSRKLVERHAISCRCA
jgi:hypothetical protein